MKRKIEKIRDEYHATFGDPRTDFTDSQLLWIGSLAMLFNELEHQIDIVFWRACGLRDAMALEVSTRINGIDGKIEIIKAGAKDFGLDPKTLELIAITLGESGFKYLKGCRDAIIHARAHNAPRGVGVRLDRKATIFEVLLSEEALKAVYEHMTGLRIELNEISQLLLYASQLKSISSDQGKGQLVSLISIATSQLKSHQKWRGFLPQLPKFPEEHLLIEARDEWYQAQIKAQQETLAAMLNDKATK